MSYKNVLTVGLALIAMAGCSNVQKPMGEDRVIPSAKPISAAEQRRYEEQSLRSRDSAAVNHRKFDVQAGDQGLVIPLYGNWCGPGYPKTGENPPVVDKVDAACKRHDLCYDTRGQYSCSCDVQLNEELAYGLYIGEYNATQESMARDIHRYFSISPCSGSAEGKLVPTRVLNRAHEILQNMMTSPSNED